MPSQMGWDCTWCTRFQPICGTLKREPSGCSMPSRRKRTTRPGSRPRPAVSASSLRSNSICSPTHTPIRGLFLEARSSASCTPESRRRCMQSRMAPWPGRTMLSALSISAGSPEMSTFASGATARSACATERRLPMPLSTTTILFMVNGDQTLKTALGRRDHPGRAGIEFGGHAQRTAEGLEHGLALVVGVFAPQIIDVQRHQGVVDETLEEFMGQVDIEAADHGALPGHVHFQAGAARKIDHHARQGFVERHVGVAVAADALLVADGLGEGHAQGDAGVFHRVVGVDVQVDQAVAGDLVQHMVEEGHAGVELLLAGAVQVDGDTDLGLVGVADDFGGAVHDVSALLRAARKAAFSSGVLTVTRMQFASSPCILPRFLTRTFACVSLAVTASESATRNSRKLALESNTSTPGKAASWSFKIPRAAFRSSACWSRISMCSRANSAATWVSTLTL